MARVVILLITLSIAAAATVDLVECINSIKAFNFEAQCVRLLISKVLGYAVMMGSAIVKLP
jgi:hypothetical protein